VQEAAGKRAEVPDLDLDWELIGHLQSNKAAQALKIFDRIQSVDSLKLAQRLNRMAGDERCRLRCLLQVNTGEDPRKFGFGVTGFEREFEELLPLEHLLIEGFMTIAPVEDGSGVARRAFARLRELAEEARVRSGLSLPELSMGMSGDLAEAIAEGSTLIRVGSALYGERE
jgi:pyridoxal phosphate enzyme (YggS family)